MEWSDLIWGIGGWIVGYFVQFFFPRTFGLNVFFSNIELIDKDFGRQPGDMLTYTYRATLTIFNNTTSLKRIELQRINLKSESWENSFKLISRLKHYDVEPNKKIDTEIRFTFSIKKINKLRLIYKTQGLPFSYRKTTKITSIAENLSADSVFINPIEL